MIYVTHPLEDESKTLTHQRELQGRFFTAQIIRYLPEYPIFNFPLNWVVMRKEMGLATTEPETLNKAVQFLAKADAAIFIMLPGRELCNRSQVEKLAARRLDIPCIEFPFLRQRYDQQYKQNSLSADQKRALNILQATLQNP